MNIVITKNYYRESLMYETYTVNGKNHNENGHAIQRWYENGKLKYQAFYINGKPTT